MAGAVSVAQQARQLLKQTAGRITPARLRVLEILLNAQAALSHQDIEQQVAQYTQPMDRVTLYRALDWLVAQGIAHKIHSAERTWLYNAQVENTPQHAHFYCKQCAQVFCLEHVQPALLLSLPAGYKAEAMELNLQGYCPACQAQSPLTPAHT